MGVYAQVTGSGSDDNNGGWFEATGTGGRGEFIGVGGYAGGTNSTRNIGIFGQADGNLNGINWAGYFAEGDVKIENNLELDGELNTSSGGSSNMAPVFYMNVKTEFSNGSWTHGYSYSNSSYVNSNPTYDNNNNLWEIEFNSSNFDLTDECIVIVTPQMYMDGGSITQSPDILSIYKDSSNEKIYLGATENGEPIGFSLIIYKP